MTLYNIDSLIERSGIRPGDSFWVDKMELGMVDHHVIYLGPDSDGFQWFVGRLSQGVCVFTEDQLQFLIKATKKARINKFTGPEELRSKAVDRMIERLDRPTFLIILRHSEGYQKDLVAANKGFSWKKLGLAGLGVGLLGVAGIALKAWMDSKDKK